MIDNQLEPYWRADDAFRAVTRYLRSRGASNVTSPEYGALPLDAKQRTELWIAMYVPDTNPEIAARFPERIVALDGTLPAHERGDEVYGALRVRS